DSYWTLYQDGRQRLAPDRPGIVKIRITLELAEGLIEYEWNNGSRRNGRPDNGDATRKAHAYFEACNRRYNEFRNSLASYGESGRRRLKKLESQANQAREEYLRPCEITGPEVNRAEFAEKLLNNRPALKRIAEKYLYEFYFSSEPVEAPPSPCN